MSKELRVLLVEDSEEDSLLLIRELRRGGYKLIHMRVETAESMRRALHDGEWDVVISDYRMPSFDALGALQVLHETGRDIPFIIVSGKIGEDLAVEAMKSGASDYLMKGNLARLVPVMVRELREAEERRTHRLTQDAVRRGKAEWESVFDAVSDLIIITDADGVVLRCNGRVSAYFPGGYGAIIGRRIDEIFFGSQQPEGKLFRFLHSVQSEADEDIRFPNLSGWYNVASYPMRTEGSNRPNLVFIIKDITKRREVEEEKRTSDRELLTLYAVAFRLQYTKGVDKVMGDLLFQLHNMLQMDFSCIHLFEDDKLKMRASLGVSPAFEKAMKTLPRETQWATLAQAGRPFLGEEPDARFPARAKSAAIEMGLHSWCTVPLKIGQEVMGVMTVGTVSGRSYSDRDVFLLCAIAGQLAVLIDNYGLYDKMKEKAEELYRSKEELKENLHKVKRANIELGRLNTAKNNFIGIASHELKTPITSIMGGVEFLLKYSGIQMSPEQHNIFVSVYEGTIQLRKLVEDLLSISRIEAQGPLAQKKPASLMRVCREVHDLFALPLSERHIKVEITGDDVLVPVDEAFAMLAVRNLLENAIKFTRDGGCVRLTGRVLKQAQLKEMTQTLHTFYPSFPGNVAATEKYYLLQVRDNGIGIPPDERVRVFEKFYGVGDIDHHSSGATAFMSKGSGLGLSIVRGIMDAHEGAVWVEEAEGGGSTFSLLFPIE
ncbi:flagellar biogenesis master response receiver sensor histidine kinase, PAS and GAF domain-containing [Citrifermentans bemidjiense Bem]|uniref:histidine kinase n=1 Tax=Citrifermentans bemidjiense (strain ATCC BAA-1014 / DSM 16622 / JCM 12645 / Bem) TaxID=404380 RepID=B5E7Q7_CITBB|nr:ATP-binding protein [Citrifermentans bemidjiense]ACH37043.1 flagellar biogenesis master response receiver sensor histidine kinase, PAS and GAF domain-containing [Citrifermentans bemidjiense Bem]